MGMPGLETLMPIVYTKGVLEKRLTLNQYVDKLSASPAKIMGLFPRKGTLQPGSDADVTVIHPTMRRKIDYRDLQTNCDWSPFQGWSLAGFAEHTLCRGARVVTDYEFVGRNGHGTFLARDHVGRPT